jgi:hypothetical protein
MKRLVRPEITHYLIRATEELAEILGIALDKHDPLLSLRTDHTIPHSERIAQ